MNTNHFVPIWAIAICMSTLFSCDNYKEPLEFNPSVEVPVFYGADFIGHYESDKIFSNSADVSNLIRLVLDLQIDAGGIVYTEYNPASGTIVSDSINVQGGWNMNANRDTLFLKSLIGSHLETKSIDSWSSDTYTTSYETVVVYDYEEIAMPFRRLSPGKYLLEREFNGAYQKYYLTKW